MQTISARDFLKSFVSVLLIFALAVPAAFADDDERRKPPTQTTEKLSPKVFEKLTQAQTALDEKKPAQALAVLDELIKDEKLNDYEKAQIYNFYAAVHYENNDLDATISDYVKILKLEKAPQQLKDNALFRLAQLYFVKEEYANSIRILDKWIAGAQSVSPDAYMLKAQAYYQLENFEDAKVASLDALRAAKERKQQPKENWLALLRAVYYELGDYKPAARLLEVLIKLYPKPSYYKQLAGMYGLLEDQEKQLYIMHAAYVAGMLESEGDILNMARLYMAEDAPAPAIDVLQKAMEAGQIDPEDPDNLQLLGQAMALGQEYDAQIPVLSKLARTTGESKHYLYLGQAQLALNRWGDAADSLRQVLRGEGVENRSNVQIQLGMALFNAGRLKESRRVFIDASTNDEIADVASNWVKYVDNELKRKQALEEL